MISRQYEISLMVRFKQIKFENPKLRQFEIANHLSYSSTTLQRYKNDKNMLSPYWIQPNITNKRSEKVSNTNLDNNSQCEHDLKRPQLTSNDLVKPDTNTEFIIKRTSNKRNKSVLKAGSAHEIVEFIEKYLDKIFHNNNL